MKIVVASTNTGKMREFQSLFSGTGLELLPQSALGLSEVEETGLTFVENALLKARLASRESALPALADDSGLVVPVLQGAPGIYSARYAGPQAKSEDNIKKLLLELAPFSEEQRQAYFHCTLVFMEHEKDPAPLLCQANWIGQILFEPRGKDGFGYDPIFKVAENKSAAELSMTQKNELSHRGQALRLLKTLLNEKYQNRSFL
jgi:XTP/dITP diphosphohydrolase